MWSLREMCEWHSRNLDHNPVLAHWSSAVFAVCCGCGFGCLRGLVVAATLPPQQRWRGFTFAVRGATPLYVIPFVAGTQLDCYSATAARAGRPPPLCTASSGAADLG